MLGPFLFFSIAFITLSAILWAGIHLFQAREDPLRERLEQLQSSAGSTIGRSQRRNARGGTANTFLYMISLLPGMDDYLSETEKELAQAGIRRKQALAWFVAGHLLFLLTAISTMLYLQRDNPITTKFGALVAAGLLGWLLPNQVLHRLVKRYRNRLQNALPDT